MIDQLIKLGFSEGEAKVYAAALELGETTVARISEKAQIERTTVYGFIDSLKRRGYLTLAKRGKKTVYAANNPKRLRVELDEKEKLVEAVLPQLLSITNAIDKKPTIRYFDTIESIYDIYRETLEYPDHTIRMWMSSRGMWYDDEKFWRDFYMPSRAEKKIALQAIMQRSEAAEKFVAEDVIHLRQTRLTEEDSIATDIMLYGRRSIAIISYDEMTGLVIESDRLFQTLSGFFSLYWESCEE
jgi:sugar-specific transcriptional regulator TrmB